MVDTQVGVKEFGGIDTDSENKQRVSLYLDKKTMQVVDSFIKKNEMRREAINNVRKTRGKIKLGDIAKGWYNEK